MIGVYRREKDIEDYIFILLTNREMADGRVSEDFIIVSDQIVNDVSEKVSLLRF